MGMFGVCGDFYFFRYGSYIKSIYLDFLNRLCYTYDMLILKVIILVIALLGGIAKKRNRGLIVIPGLGQLDRLDTVLSNLKILEPSINKGWDCVVYVYAQREIVPKKSYFWGQESKIAELRRFCNIIENPKHYVTDHLYMVQPSLIHRMYDYVFILLDDCKITSLNDFNFEEFIVIMKKNKLTLASPRITNANKGGGQGFRTIMQMPPPQGGTSPGYVVSFIEIFAVVLTMDAYTALWELLCPSVNPYGWGYDLWYNNYAKARVKGHRMGIISKFLIHHEQPMGSDGTSQARSDNTKFEDKWKALVSQERFAQHHYGQHLHRFRETLDLKNMSWNGAVLDLLTPTATGRNIFQAP